MAEKKILVVDDDPHIRRLIAELLAAEGFQALVTGDGTPLHRATVGAGTTVRLDVSAGLATPTRSMIGPYTLLAAMTQLVVLPEQTFRLMKLPEAAA